MLAARVRGHPDDKQNYSKVVSPLVTLQNAINTPTSVDEIIVLLLYIGETTGQKVGLLKSFAPKSPLPLVQLCMEYEHLVKAKFWGKYLLKSVRSFVHNILLFWSA
jgi:hypothetical protein